MQLLSSSQVEIGIREHPLQVRIVRRLCGQAGENCVPGREAVRRRREMSELKLDVADALIGKRQIELPCRVFWISMSEALPDCEALPVGVRGLGQIPLGLEHVADLVVGNR